MRSATGCCGFRLCGQPEPPFPGSRIVYASSGPSTLEKLLSRHVDDLVDDFRTGTPLATVVAEFRRSSGQIAVADFRNLLPKLLATRLKFSVPDLTTRPTFPGFALSWPRRGLCRQA